MARLIDADALLEKMKGTPRYFDVKFDIEEMPTAYDVTKVVERLEVEKAKGHYDFNSVIGEKNVWQKAIDIVQEVAKECGKDTNVRSNVWIPCSEILPEEQDEYLVYWTAEGFKGKCFYEIIEYHLEDGWIGEIPQAPFGKYTVIAWMELPAYQKGE
jgi:hypothetical protein